MPKYDDVRDRLRPACKVPAGQLASEACPIGSAGERTDEGLEDLDPATLKRAMQAGFDAEARGDSYQTGWHSVTDPALAKIQRARGARGDNMQNDNGCQCGRSHNDGEHTDAKDDYDLMGNITPAAAARRAREQLAQPSLRGRAAPVRNDVAPNAVDDTDEEAAKARLKAANAAMFRGGSR